MTDPFDKPTTYRKMSLAEVFSPIGRHRRVTTVAFVATFALVNLLAWVWAANYYKAHMQIVVVQSRVDPVVTTGQDSSIIGGRQITTDQVSSEVALLHGTDMLEVAAQTCGLVAAPKESPWGHLFSQSSPPSVRLAAATAKLATRLTVEAAPTSDVIEVKYGHRGRPETPACVLQQLAQLYVDKHLRLRRQAGSAALFAEQVERFRQATSDAENQLIQFSKSNGSGDPETLMTALAEQLAAEEGTLSKTRQAVAGGEGRLLDIKRQLEQIPARAISGSLKMPAYYLLQSLQTSLLDEQLKRGQLLVKYDPSYPLIKEQDREIEKTAQALDEARNKTYVSETTDRDGTFELLRQEAAKSEADVADGYARLDRIQLGISSKRAELVKLEGQTVRRNALAREVKANEAKYLLYLTKLEQERLSAALDERRIADVAIAVPPTVPVLPAYNPSLIFAAGTLFAAIVGLSAAYLAEYTDPFLRTPQDVDRELGLEVLAVFPVRVGRRMDQQIEVLEKETT